MNVQEADKLGVKLSQELMCGTWTYESEKQLESLKEEHPVIYNSIVMTKRMYDLLHNISKPLPENDDG